MSEHNGAGFERLADWVEGRLSEEEAREIEERVAAAGDETRADVEWLRAFARAGEEISLEAPPQEVRDELVRRFEAWAEGQRPPGFLERLVATLTFDGGLQPAFGVRSAGTSEERQLVYGTNAADIVLNIRPRGGRLDLDGQIFPADEAEPGPFGVQLLDEGGTEVAVSAADDLGEFAFESVAPGTYQILASNERVEILILPVELSR